MSEDNYRMAYTMISVTIVPAASISTFLFRKIGPAWSCVMANVFTGFTIIALIYIASLSPTRMSYAGFLTVLYFGSPFTFISNVSTGPMLDRITPMDKKGHAQMNFNRHCFPIHFSHVDFSFVQGLNNAIFKFTAAVFQLVLGIMADKFGSSLVLLICVGVSFFASIVNLPLIFYPRLGAMKADKPKVKLDDETASVYMDEDEIQDLLDQAKYVPQRDIFHVNKVRAANGLPFLKSRFGAYSRDQNEMVGCKSFECLKFLRATMKQRLHVIHEHPRMKTLYLQSLNGSRPGTEETEVARREMERWVSDYLYDSGYFVVLENPQLFKSLFARSFPRLSSGGDQATEEGVEDLLINILKLLDVHLERERRVSKRLRILSGWKAKTA
mmetsp:Transcript_35724/g.76306  ORF Transcript_35724/g.76306 Transcript_35724/m.76306 type:complete len:384 (+) Transcript_35724:609-1760(+)